MKEKVYMICDYTDDKAMQIGDCPNVGVEYMGNCGGRIVKANGEVIGNHHSSSFGWLRNDLRNKLDNPDNYEIIDLIGKEIPNEFRLVPKHV